MAKKPTAPVAEQPTEPLTSAERAALLAIRDKAPAEEPAAEDEQGDDGDA